MAAISRGADDNGHRWYEGEQDDGTTFRALSVTQIIGLALEEDETGLEIWKEQNDGSGDAPYWQHLFWYSGPRGTLCHYHALSKFEGEDRDLWGPEEGEAMTKVIQGPSDETVKRWNEEADHHVPGDPSEITYSVMKDEGIVDSREQYEILFEGSTGLPDILRDDIDFFLDKFEYLTDRLDVSEDDVVAVERKLLNVADGYGGQCDLVYEDQNGETVLADLKTSSGLRQKDRLQVTAYKHAVEKVLANREIDRVEVWRISPSKRVFEIHADHVPPHAEAFDWYTDDYWFSDKYGDFSYDSLSDMWEKFKDLTEEAHAAVNEG